ncbi:hypothetical protein LDENG_00199530, partial [Lucifuga dentata]
VHDFRVCVRRSEAWERCRLKGEFLLRADVEALLLLDLKTGNTLFTWPYRYLRRFGRDKSTFSFEAGRRCDSGEGSFEFDTKQGNALFQAVEAAIDLQRVAAPLRTSSAGGPKSPETPHGHSLPPLPLNPPLVQSRMLPQPRPQPPPAQAEGVYSMVNDASNLQLLHHKDRETSSPPRQQQQRPLQMSRLEPPVDKTLTGVKSLTLDTRGVPIPRKNQVKMISSCPLPYGSPDPTLDPVPKLDQTYSQITQPGAAEQGTQREKRGDGSGVEEPEYSLPFDTIANNIMDDIFTSHLAHESAGDPLYDSIDESKFRSGLRGVADTPKAEHIYDEPEGCAAAAISGQKPTTPVSVYDDPEEMRGDAWRIMGTATDPKGHEYPYNPCMDDYAVPKQVQRAFPLKQSTHGEEEEDEEEKEESEAKEEQDLPYNNVVVKIV